MDEKLNKLFLECKYELKGIGIDIEDSSVGKITIDVAKRKCKRYGCCKQKNPDLKSKYYEIVRSRKYKRYAVYKEHNIEISKWVLELNDDIIKNTIIHELIHCFPKCNNHGDEFKKYAKYINYKLGYNISRVGDKEKDLRNNNIEIDKEKYNYKVECVSCGYVFYRKRMLKNFCRKYRCGYCKGKFDIQNGEFYI